MTLFIGDDDIRIDLDKTTSQDLLLDLGPPLRKFYKEDSRISRVWAKESRSSSGQSSGCQLLPDMPDHQLIRQGFWNYFQLGLDFLVSESGVVKKIIAHSNIVSHART